MHISCMARIRLNLVIDPRIKELGEEIAWRHRTSFSRLVERLVSLAALDDQLTSLALSGANVPIEEEDE